MRKNEQDVVSVETMANIVVDYVGTILDRLNAEIKTEMTLNKALCAAGRRAPDLETAAEARESLGRWKGLVRAGEIIKEVSFELRDRNRTC